MARLSLAITLLLVVVAGAALPTAASASRSQLSIMEDDHLVLYSGPAVRDSTLDQMHRLGVTTLQVLVIWRHLAPSPRSSTHPVFDANDPASYSGWEPYDGVVASAQARGIRVLFTPTGPIPDWASECGRKVSRRWVCSPRVSDYGDFVEALGRRYSTVDAWSFWNEPNHSAWLRPQSTAAPRYRALARAGLAPLYPTGPR